MKCPSCPVPGPCLGTTDARFAFLCEWAASGSPVHVNHVRARNGLPVDRPTPPEPDPSRPSVRTYHAATRTLLACPYRDHRCGCNLPTCHAHRGDRDDGDRATRDHCLACLKQTWSIT